MADQHAGARDRTPASGDGDDPLAADRRTLVIGASAMVALILVGVVSAQLFARGGCVDVVDPEPADARAVVPAEDLVDEVVDGVDGARAVDMLEQAGGGPVELAVAVGEAAAIAPLTGGLLTSGPTVTSLDDGLAPIATFETDDVVVGDGTAVFDVVVANDATGQTDAFVVLRGADLAVGTCVDTAVVGSPFAFLLGAGDGELLLLRADEDGDSPHLQLRGPDAATVWDAHLDLPSGPPGTLAERLSAGLGPGAVVAARRVGPQEEGEVAPALVSVARDDGSGALDLDNEVLADAAGLDPALPLRWHVAAVGETTALIHGRPDPSGIPVDGDGAVQEDGALLLLDLTDGSVVTSVSEVGPLVEAAAADPGPAGDRYVVATEAADTDAERVTLLGAGGAVIDLGTLVDEPRFAWVEDAVLVAGRDSLTRIAVRDADEATPNGAILPGGRFADVTVTEDGRVAAIVTARDGGEGVLLVTAPLG